jgi:hypothetical protein
MTATITADQIELRAVVEELERRGRTFGQFFERHNPTALTIEHIPRLVNVAERVMQGRIPRLIVIAPPRYLKSEVFTRMLPAYYLRRYPRRRVGLFCWDAGLAWEFSEYARSYFAADGGRLAQETRSKQRWNTSVQGGMWAKGVGGAMLGRGFNLGVVDDPTDPEKAISPTYQRRFHDWWPNKFLSRQDPYANIIFVMQRLGVGDPL